MFKDSLRSLKNSFSKAVFYWLTFVLTSMFIFLFFNISMSDEIGITFVNQDQNTALTVTLFVIAVCMIIIFFANDFYVRNKSKDLAVRLVCGAKYIQLAEYLLIQTFILLALAIPAGILLGLLAIPLTNQAVTAILKEPFVISVHGNAVFMTSLILGLVVFWTTYLNMAFAYRNSAAQMMDETAMRNPMSNVSFNVSMDEIGKAMAMNAPAINAQRAVPVPQAPVAERRPKKKKSGKWKKVIALIFFLAPLALFYVNTSMLLGFSMIGIIGFNMCMKHVFIPFLNRRIREKKLDHPKSLAALGFIRSDLQIMRNNIILFLVCAILLVALLLQKDTSNLEMMLALLSYITMNVLLSMAIMFKYQTELSHRKQYFGTMDQLGYLDSDKKKVILGEVTGFYGFILAVALLYMINIFIALLIQGSITAGMTMALTAFLVVPLVICCFITLVYYNHAIFKEKQ